MISKIPKECPISKKKSVIEYKKSRHQYVWLFFVFRHQPPAAEVHDPQRAQSKPSKETAAAAPAYLLFKMQLPIALVIKVNASSSQHF